jgi:ribose 5-phosphate isomerase B
MAFPRAQPENQNPREIARRAAQRALAERALRETGGAQPSDPTLPGVHVAIDAAPAVAPRSGNARGKELVDAASLRSTAEGSRVPLPRGAIVTDLAREEARRRRITFVEGAGAEASTRGTRRGALGADHGGYALKREILGWLPQFEAIGVDLGTRDENPCDYPDFARAVGQAVASGEVDFGIVIDGAGIGSAIAANKIPGVRAANCHDVAMSRNAREHNFANVLTLGARMITGATAYQVIQTFLSTATGADRHAARVRKITDIEGHYARNAHRQ